MNKGDLAAGTRSRQSGAGGSGSSSGASGDWAGGGGGPSPGKNRMGRDPLEDVSVENRKATGRPLQVLRQNGANSLRRRWRRSPAIWGSGAQSSTGNR